MVQRYQVGQKYVEYIAADPLLTDIARPYSVVAARPDDFLELSRDISAVEKKILGMRRDGDWQAAIDSTQRSCSESHAVRHPSAPGVLLFGMTDIPPLAAGLIWMMQSEAFETAALASGAGYAFKLRRAARAYIESRCAAYGTVFNFVSSDRTEKIKWLKQMGFLFHPAVSARPAGMLMFGAGEGLSAMAQSAEVWDAFFAPAHGV